jgi:hypothetical protein
VSLSLTVSQELEALNQLAQQKQSLGRQESTQGENETGAIADEVRRLTPEKEVHDKVGVAIGARSLVVGKAQTKRRVFAKPLVRHSHVRDHVPWHSPSSWPSWLWLRRSHAMCLRIPHPLYNKTLLHRRFEIWILELYETYLNPPWSAFVLTNV